MTWDRILKITQEENISQLLRLDAYAILIHTITNNKFGQIQYPELSREMLDNFKQFAKSRD